MKINPKDIKRVMANRTRLVGPVERLLLERNAEKSEKRDTLHLHPSEICKRDWCPRSSWYKISGRETEPESFTFQRLNIFAEGDLIHSKWQAWLKEAGVLEESEVPIKDDEHLIIGHTDGIINDSRGRAILEIKSLGVGTVRFEDYDLFAMYSKKEISLDEMWNRIKTPFPSHIRQTQLYMHCTGIHDAVVLYEWKASQDVKEFSISYDPDIVTPILASCLSVVRSLEAQTPPDRPAWLYEDHRVCKSCPYRKECWSENRNQRQQGA